MEFNAPSSEVIKFSLNQWRQVYLWYRHLMASPLEDEDVSDVLWIKIITLGPLDTNEQY